MIAAQQYYIEYCSDLNVDRLYNLLPSYIPDYCLASTDKAVDRWGQLVVQAYKKVIFRSNKENSVHNFILFACVFEIMLGLFMICTEVTFGFNETLLNKVDCLALLFKYEGE
jgi:hypothetical protein